MQSAVAEDETCRIDETIGFACLFAYYTGIKAENLISWLDKTNQRVLCAAGNAIMNTKQKE